MSLINDMLRDLDTRNAAASERGGLAQNVRALPGKQPTRLNPLLLALAAASLGGAAVWLLAVRPAAPGPLAPVMAPVAPPQAAVPAPEVTTAVEATTEAPPPASPAGITEALPPAAVAAQTSAPVAAKPDSEAPAAIASHPLKLETQIKQPPASPTPSVPMAPPTAPAKPTAKPAAPALAASPSTQSQAAATSKAATEHVASSRAPAQISKQPSDGSAREQAESEYQRGVAAARRGDGNEAGTALRNALKLAPTHASARQALLGLLTEQQRWSDAETLALDGVGQLPQRSDWALLAARLMYERGDAESALSTLNQNAGAARQNADYQILHALLLQRAGRHADAANCYQTALALRPNEGRWWYGLGRALDADHREAQARTAYEKARDSGNLPTELQQAVERRLR